MNMLAKPEAITKMSSREIAELTGKRPDNVLRDIRGMLTKIDPSILRDEEYQEVTDNRGYTTEILLNKNLTLTLITGYDVNMRHKINLRWQELEAAVTRNQISLPNFQDPAEAAIAWAYQYRENQQNQQTIGLLAPKAEALHRLTDTADTFGIREAAKNLKIKQTELTTMLESRQWVYRDARGRLQAYARFIERGFLTHVMTNPIMDGEGVEHVYHNLRLTTKGVARLSVILQGEKLENAK